MEVHFSKYHGTGNDFILVDGRNSDISKFAPDLVTGMCDRHFGIGADGLIILTQAEGSDFRMNFYNSDGYPGTMCGNGGRCLVAFAGRLGIAGASCIFEAPDGRHEAYILNDGNIRLQMKDVNSTLRVKEGIFLDTGSPHLVIFCEEVDIVNVVELGSKQRHDKRFPGGTNVNFVEILEKGIKVRTFERGVENETLSCGTGVTAAAIATIMQTNKTTGEVYVITRGGQLRVEFQQVSEQQYTGIYLTGPAVEVFNGTITIAD